MPQTIVEKIFSNLSGKPVQHGDLVVVPVDGTMASDTTAPLTIKAFQAMEGQKLWDPDKCCLVIDHAAPAPNERIADLHMMMRAFAKEQGCRLFEAGEGICHQLLVENQFLKPGRLFVGADSHTCSAGAVGTMGVGVGATDLAAVWLTGKIWLRVPKTIRIEINGPLPPGVYSKDLILSVLTKTGIAGATYQAMEFSGDTIAGLSLSSRITIANMMIEAGAKTGFIDPQGLDLPDAQLLPVPDPDACYHQSYALDASQAKPMVSLPHSPAQAESVGKVAGLAVQYAFIGTCVNGRLEDLQTAASILKNARVHSETRLIVGPASRKVYADACRDGTMQTLVKAGATIIPPGCGPCVGTHNGVPGTDEVVISSGNRNFKGRMGNPGASIYLASPATVAASAVNGCISDPTPYITD